MATSIRTVSAAGLGRERCSLRPEIDDVDAELITAFLHHLEHERHNSARTRNARLAAIHSLYRYAPSVTRDTPR
jgi:site-specific recombinase XerD